MQNTAATFDLSLNDKPLYVFGDPAASTIEKIGLRLAAVAGSSATIALLCVLVKMLPILATVFTPTA